MRLILRFAAALLLLVVCLISLHEYRQFRDRRDDFESDMERTHRLVATTLSDAASTIAAHEGLEAAQRAVDQATRDEAGDVRIRWVCRGDNQPPTASTSCAMVQRPHHETVDEDGARRLLTWVPVAGAGGAIEVSETPEHEAEWSAQHIRSALTLAAMTVAAIAFASLVLGWWLVAVPTRKLRAKARAVGRGELTTDLTLPGHDELTEVAEEMNAMCRQLLTAQQTAAREASARVAAVEQLQHANRLATTGRLASGLAHELGTPLNVIEARAELIIEDPAVDDETRASARVIFTCAEQVATLVRELLTFARPRALDVTDTRLDQIAQVVVELLLPLAAQRQVQLAIGRSSPIHLPADAVLLQQAVVNLVVNALRACREGGHVSIVVDDVERTGPNDSVASRWAHLAVVDDGVGISAEVRAHLFEPFFTTRPGGEGTGLGLPIVAGILEDHRGFLEVDSSPGRGSTFHLFLPMRTREAT